jgi:hypothetical protein
MGARGAGDGRAEREDKVSTRTKLCVREASNGRETKTESQLQCRSDIGANRQVAKIARRISCSIPQEVALLAPWRFFPVLDPGNGSEPVAASSRRVPPKALTALGSMRDHQKSLETSGVRRGLGAED